ncbi:unnamed protein product [Lactuca virosa]|uniref:Uncharacterized protein n=1 Tax=Lactuca virosa TaxID=75947 RepID=A0AAU9MMH8_9ASTR|nr:unnamed protein product [Lactuca virosa]
MAKSGTLTQNPGPSAQSKPLYKPTSCNLQEVLDASLCDVILAPLIDVLKHHPLYVTFTITTSKVLFEYLVEAYLSAAVDDPCDIIQLQLINDDVVYLKKYIFLESIGLPVTTQENMSPTTVRI